MRFLQASGAERSSSHCLPSQRSALSWWWLTSSSYASPRERAARVDAFGSAAVTFLTHATAWCLLWPVIPLVRIGVIDGVSLAVVCLVAMAAFEATRALPAIAQNLEEQASAARRVFAILDARPSLREPRTAQPLSTKISKPDLEAEDVESGYPGSHRPALSGFNLELRPHPLPPAGFEF